MAGKSGKRLPSNKKRQGGGGAAATGEHNLPAASYGNAAGGVNTEGHPPQQDEQQQQSTNVATADTSASRHSSLTPRGQPQRTQSSLSEGSRGPSPMMVASPSTQGGYMGIGSMPNPYGHGGGRGMESMMHIPPQYMSAVGPDQHSHHQYQHHHQGGGLLPGMVSQPRGGPGAFHQPMPYFPPHQPGMNYAAAAPSMANAPSGTSRTAAVTRGFNMGTSSISSGPAGEAMRGRGTTQSSTAASASSTAMAAAAEGMKQLVQQDIERGLQIDFYSERDLMTLASWASFFRDQYIETRSELSMARNDRTAEAYRRATGFVERVEMKILDTSAMKQIFRRLPVMPVDDPNFVDTCYRAIIDFQSRNPPFDGFTFGSPTWRDYMWFKAGLMKVVDDGRYRFLDWYSQQIRDSLVNFIESSSSGAEDDLREASISGMQHKDKYARVKQFYVNLIEDVLPTIDEAAASGPPTTIGVKVRRFFSVGEEAFILAVIRTHLEKKQDEPKATISQDGGSSLYSKIIRATTELLYHLEAQESSHSSEDPILALMAAV